MPPRGNPITHSRNPNFPVSGAMPIGQPLGNTIGISKFLNIVT